MKKFFKWFFIIILLAGIAGGGYFVYDNYIKEQNRRNILSVVPKDAIFIIETDNLTKGWEEISESKIWHNLVKNPYFNYINEYAVLLDDFLKGNVAVDLMLKNRPLLISAHMISAKDYDFLFVVDLKNSKTLSKGFDKLLKVIDGYDVKKRKFNNTEIVELIDKKDPNFIVYFSIKDNLLLGSFTGKLIEHTIDNIDVNYWINNSQYKKVTDELSARKLFKFYFNYRSLPDYIDIYAENMREYTVPISKSLNFSAFDVNLEENKLYFDGYSTLDSLPSYFSALSDVKPGTLKAYDIISDQMASYVSIGFKSYNMFFQSLTDQYAQGNATDMEDYKGNVKMVERLLGINVQKDFFDWIGQEIAFVKLRPENTTRLEDAIVVIHSDNIEDAKSGLARITNQIRKRSPLKFEEIDYKNHTIHYLSRKGVFKLFFGDFFKNLEKPYFTYIEDFVVFSNSKEALMQMIDDYLKGHTLSHSKEFMDFKSDFEVKSNITMFIQMPKLYSNLYKFSNTETKKTIKENKDLILSFNRVGFQLISSGDMFKTKFISDHNEEAGLMDELEKLEKKASEELMSDDFDSLRFKINFPDTMQLPDGPYRTFYWDGKSIKNEGKISDGVPDGLWRTYYKSGNLKSSVNYDDGQVDGVAFFFFNDGKETKKAEMTFNEDVIEGIYQEFYENGAQKALLNYDEGKLHGDAEFFYKTGRIKIKGKYKNNQKRGKWLYYDANGKVINKKRMN